MSRTFFVDEYIRIDDEQVIVNYEEFTESYPLEDIVSVKLYVPDEEKGTAYKRLFVTFLAPSWFGWRNAVDVPWILRLETIRGDLDILTSTDGLYLSRVKKALKEALKNRNIRLKAQTV